MQDTVLERKRFCFSCDVTNLLHVLATMFVFVLHGRGFIEGISESRFWDIVTTLPAWAGVWIFLFLSGYTIGLGLFKGRYPILTEEGKLSPRGLGRFYLGRLLKLAPLYYAYCFFWELLCGNHFLVSNPKFLLQVLTFALSLACAVIFSKIAQGTKKESKGCHKGDCPHEIRSDEYN